MWCLRDVVVVDNETFDIIELAQREVVVVDEVTVEILERAIPGPAGPRGATGDPGPVGPPNGNPGRTVIAGMTVSGHRLVTPQPDDTIVYADNSMVASCVLPVWLTTGAIMQGEQGPVVFLGIVSEPSWTWAPSEPIFLGANGLLTQTAPTLASGAAFVLIVAHAISPTELFFNPKVPIVLS